MFGDTPRQSPDYGRIINARHFARVARLLDDAVNHGARTVTGGTVDASDQFIAPTLLTDMRPDAAVMHEEIFGPVLPILPFRDLGSTIAFINAREKPLALYVYARDQAVIDEVLRETSSGGACVNMSVLQFSHSNLPFGGVNNSGIGASHGIFGFQAFSHERAVLRDRFSVTPMLFPPYSRRVRKMIDFTIRYFT
jgi:aldehyde dehydrogenase (NAD+)